MRRSFDPRDGRVFLCLGHTEHFEDHLAQPLPAVVDVLGLIAEVLALDDQLPLGGDAPPLPARSRSRTSAGSDVSAASLPQCRIALLATLLTF